VSLQSVKFDHMIRFCAPSVVYAAIHHAAHKQGIKPSEWLRGAVSEALSRDGFDPAAGSEEFALVADSALVEPNVPLNLKPYCGKAITTCWPAPDVGDGYEWWPVTDENCDHGHGLPSYRIDGARVVRTWPTDEVA
jgi:hypothetical protein